MILSLFLIPSHTDDNKTTAAACISRRVLKGKDINSMVLKLQVIYTLTNYHVGVIIKEIQGTR